MRRCGRWCASAAAAGGAAAVGVLLDACGPAAGRPVASPGGAPRLAGVWDATFVLDAPPLGFDSAVAGGRAPGRVGGTLALVANHWLTAPVASEAAPPARPVVYGTYDVDFTPFGFDPRDPDRVPEVVAMAAASGVATAGTSARRGRVVDDTVTVVLGPTSERAQVLLVGATHGDSVLGTWRLRSAGRWGTTAAGRFVLVARRSRR